MDLQDRKAKQRQAWKDATIWIYTPEKPMLRKHSSLHPFSPCSAGMSFAAIEDGFWMKLDFPTPQVHHSVGTDPILRFLSKRWFPLFWLNSRLFELHCVPILMTPLRLGDPS
jgi:hypothetical protein